MTELDSIIAELEKSGNVLKDVSARTLTTFGSGGFVSYLVLPKTQEELLKTLDLLSEQKYHVLGAGSKVIISDNGLKCVVGLKELKGYSVKDDEICAFAGEYLPILSKVAAQNDLTGLEFANGIPGTLGGAIRMNAGAFGSDMSKVLKEITLYKNGKLYTATPKELGMRYRDGSLKGAIAIKAVIKLSKGDPERIKYLMKENFKARDISQPKEPSAGSVFKRINGNSPAVYAQGAGLKGVRIGGAAVSGKHSNFIVNLGGATSRDYLRLSEVVKDKVRDRYGVELEEEFIFMRDKL